MEKRENANGGVQYPSPAAASLDEELEVYAGTVISHSESCHLSAGDVMNGATIETGGYMYISSGGVANGTVVNSVGHIYIYDGGVANDNDFRGRMYISSGGVANRTTLTGSRINNGTFYGSMHVFKGGTASDTVINSWGDMHISSGGTADGVTVNSDGCIFISSGGSGRDITLKTGGRLGGFSFNTEKYIEEINNSAVIAPNVTIIGSNMYVSDGGVAADITANYWADMHIRNGGSGSNITAANWGDIFVSSGGVLSKANIKTGGYVCISSGGSAENLRLAGRMQISSGGVQKDTVVSRGGNLKILSGGCHSGSMQIATGATVSAAVGAVIDFTIAGRKNTDTYLINNLALITGAPTFTITVSASQASGTYSLASGVSGFTGTITVKDSSGKAYGTISVGGGVLKYGKTSYSLTENAGSLLLHVDDGTAPVEDQVKLFSAGVLISQGNNLSDQTVGKQCSMSVFAGVARNTGITDGGRMYVSSGGKAMGVNVENGGYFYVRSGLVNDLSVVSGSADIRESSYAENLLLGAGASANVYNHTTVSSNTVLADAVLRIFGGATAKETVVSKGGALHVSEGGVASDTTIMENAQMVIHAPSMLGANTAASVMLHSGGELILENNTILTGENQFAGTVTATGNVNAQNAEIIFDISKRTTSDSYIISDLSKFSDAVYSIYLSPDQEAGDYVLADGADGFTGSITVANNEFSILGTLSINETLKIEDTIYSLALADHTLFLNVEKEIADTTAPVIYSWNVLQGVNNYNFSLYFNASDDKTAAGNLKYEYRYAFSEAALATAEFKSGQYFVLAPESAGKKCYVQTAVTDEAGNTRLSNVSTIDVLDFTAPVLSNKLPVVTVNGNTATVSWEKGTDNVGITTYKATIGNVVRKTSGTSVVFTDIPTGNYVCHLEAFDEAGNVSREQSVRFTVEAPQTTSGSLFKWQGNQYVFVQEKWVTAGDFQFTVTGGSECGYMMTDRYLIDAEKDSLTLSNAYLYLNTCWAATVSNMFMRSGWGTGLFASEDDLLKYFTQSFTRFTISGNYTGLTGGLTRLGVEWLMTGANFYWPTNISTPISRNSGGFYKNSIGSIGNYFVEENAVFRNGQLLGFEKYIPGTGFSTTTASVYNSYGLLKSAFEHLQNGDAVGMSISWHQNSYLTQRAGGHAVTVYGFVYDESKKGTADYFTGVIIADSDDDFLNGNTILGTAATAAPNRVKILDIEYNAAKGVYVFSDYGSYGVIDGFQYLEKKPSQISPSSYSCVNFSLNSAWNASYSISTSPEEALNGNRKRISAADDLYVAVSLENIGLGDSGNFTIKAIIDDASADALEFSIDQILTYGERNAETVLNLGKLSQGLHSITLEISDGDNTDSISIGNVYVTGNMGNNSNLNVNNGTINMNGTLADGSTMIVAGNGFSIGTIVGNNCEQIICGNGIARDSIITAGGTLTVQAGGLANSVQIENGGHLEAYGNVEDMQISGHGFAEAGKNSNVTGTEIEAQGTMSVRDNGTAEKTEVYGNFVVQNGSAVETQVYEKGFMVQMEGSVSSKTVVQDGGYHYIYAGAAAKDNTLSGETARQTVTGKAACAVDNTLDGATQVVISGGVAENNRLSGGAIQEVYDGGTALGTELSDGSWQTVKNATVYDTVLNDTASAFILSGALSDNCLVRQGGTLTVGNLSKERESQISCGVNDLTVEYGGNVIMAAGAMFYGINTIAGTLTVSGEISGGRLDNLATDPVLVFDLTRRSGTDDFMVNDLTLCKDLFFQINLDAEQPFGMYKLAASAPSDIAFTVCGSSGEYWGELDLNSSLIAGEQLISLVVEDDSLWVKTEVSPYGKYEMPEDCLFSGENYCSWSPLAGVSQYVVQFSRDDFETVMTFCCTENSISLHNLPYDLKWRIRAEESSVWTVSTEKSIGDCGEAKVVSANKDWNFDLLFVNPDGIWESKYAAQHTGTAGSWKGTGEMVSLEGKNKFSDVFQGSTDTNILVLTDDVNGDALFVDDIYSALGESSRLSRIREIRAGAGNDIVDMTSPRFVYEGSGMTIYGGSGDDTVWANQGSSRLYGDAGNDRLVGGENDDIIVGGSGNDSLHGGGGRDAFFFGGDFGVDTVSQLGDGSVTLFFESENVRWDEKEQCWSDGKNKVFISGNFNVEISFAPGEEFAEIPGIFEESVTANIFEAEISVNLCQKSS